MNTTENNKIIAEFMGVLEWEENTFNINGSNYSLGGLKYHFDWNWLMEVVEKIETTLWDITQTKPYIRRKESFKGTTSLCGEFIIGYDNREEFKGWTSYIALGTLPSIVIKDFDNRFKTKIEAYYNACLAFIQWHNEQKSAKEN